MYDVKSVSSLFIISALGLLFPYPHFQLIHAEIMPDEGALKLFHHESQKFLERQQLQDISSHHHRKLTTTVNPVCAGGRDISSGPNALIHKLTDPSIYDLTKRPSIAYHSSREATTEPDLVYNRLVVNDIVNLDELTQSLTTSFYEMFTWQDVRLQYNTSGNGACVVTAMNPSVPSILLNIDQLSEGVDKIIWTPSTLTINVQHETTGMAVGFVFPDGTVVTIKQKELRTSCTMHFGKYPFDEHRCSVDVSTLGQSDFDVTLMPGDPQQGLDQLFDTMLLTSYEVGEFFASDLETGTFRALFDGIKGSIKFKRNTQYFGTHVLLPDLLLHLSIYCGFWIDSSNAQARVALCIISGLSFRILMASISAKLPSVTYSIWVVDFMIASSFLSVLALVHYGIVAYFLSIEHVRLKLLDGFKRSKVPEWLRKGVVKASTIFQQAEFKHQDFLASSQFALKKKGEPSDTYVSTVFSHRRFRGKHGSSSKHRSRNKVASMEELRQLQKNKMLEMIKIEETEVEDEDDNGDGFQDIENDNAVNKMVQQYPLPQCGGVLNYTTTMLRKVNSEGRITMERSMTDSDESNDDSESISHHIISKTGQISPSPLQPQRRGSSSSSEKTSIHTLSTSTHATPARNSIPTTSLPYPTNVHVSNMNGIKIFAPQSNSVHNNNYNVNSNNSLPSSNRSSVSHRSSIGSNFSGYSSSQCSTGRRSVDEALVMLTTYEVMTIAYVKEAFEKFDSDHNGVLSIHELKKCFRAFGKYYTTTQVCALMEAFRTSQGSSLGKKPILHFVDFFCLLVELEQHEPLPEFATTDYLAIPPSLILDMVMRVCFPILVVFKVWVYFLLLSRY